MLVGSVNTWKWCTVVSDCVQTVYSGVRLCTNCVQWCQTMYSGVSARRLLTSSS